MTRIRHGNYFNVLLFGQNQVVSTTDILFFRSPVSLLFGMGMLFEGMSDKSRSEVAKDLGLGQSHDQFLAELRVK